MPKRSHLRGTCLYRGPDGGKCFVGALITDEEYKPEMEGKAIKELAKANDNLIPERLIPFAEILLELQAIHDYYFDEREIKLRDFARKFNLTIPEDEN
jgi:hypothetical protein